ncbi:Triosephosphate isomerase [Westerdykella ornata]|uniref:Triosephosphate isomerase n=1 Tax=Westerdykella ornata TaxID=318751 RepID=A0A6A6JTD1_WESOR|nr:Triosephosphate isomerase [Westerdykella ornata]KAF2279006.1 Triosephosphate isomerase [Westerdykella ornata]
MASPEPPRRLVGVSTKMYFSLQQTFSYTWGLLQLDPLAFNARIDLFLIPDFLSLHPCAAILGPSHIKLGAQDTHWEDRGAYTGEVSPAALAEVGVRIVEIGHAERRALFGETDEVVARKAKAVSRHGMVPLVCVGETTHGSVASAAVGQAIQECRVQVEAVLRAVPEEQEIVFAYEPVWAIGAQEPADPDHVVHVTKAIREMVGQRKGLVRIVYGGSAGPGTFGRIKDGVDGLFLGRFAHDIKNLEKVIKEMAEV